MIRNVGDYEGIGSSGGSLTISAVTETTVAGSITFSYTDPQSRPFMLSGSFEASRCAP